MPYRTNKNVAHETRRSIIKTYNKDRCTVKVAITDKEVNLEAAKKIISIIKKEGRTDKKPRSGKIPTKNTERVRNLIKEYVSVEPQITLAQIRTKLNMIQSQGLRSD